MSTPLAELLVDCTTALLVIVVPLFLALAFRKRRALASMNPSAGAREIQRRFSGAFDPLLVAARALDRGNLAERHLVALSQAFDAVAHLDMGQVRPSHLQPLLVAARHELGNTVHAVRMAGQLALAGEPDDRAGSWFAGVKSSVAQTREQLRLLRREMRRLRADHAGAY